MEKKTLMEVIKENKGAIIKRLLIIVGSVGGVLLASKLLAGDDEQIEALEESDDAQDVEFTESEIEE